MNPTNTQLIKNNFAEFSFYRNQYVYYVIKHDGKVYQFPIVIDPQHPDYDLGNATLNAKEKGITMLRYINKAQKAGTFTCQ